MALRSYVKLANDCNDNGILHTIYRLIDETICRYECSDDIAYYESIAEKDSHASYVLGILYGRIFLATQMLIQIFPRI